ncbi:MAG: ZIP family metal transporter [Bacilli bacterium]|nr:ZIP family metal transporter [Bacilli bacterium]
MENVGWIILITFLAGFVGTGIGGLIGALCKKDSRKIVSLLLAFAGGIMLAVVCFDLLTEALNPIEGVSEPPLLIVGFTFLGFCLVAVLNHFIDKKLGKEVEHTSREDHPNVHDDLDEMIHADHLEHHRKSDNRLFWAGVVMLLVIALHNFPEGMVIGATYAKQPELIMGGSALLIAIVIGLHNIPEGMAVSVPLISGGAKKWKAILLTAVSGLPTVAGAVLGFALGMIDPIALSISLSLASGAMLYVVFDELIPESLLIWKSKLPGFMLLIGLLIGFLLVLI